MRTRLDTALISLLAVLAAVYFFFVRAPYELPALLLPVLVHELSHVLALWLLGLRVRGLRLEPQGLCIRYEGDCPDWAHAAASLAGPIGGFVYALFARRFPQDWLRLSADLSLLFSLFNLLPLMPLDGGRVFLLLCRTALGEEGERLFYRLSRMLLALLLLFGVYAAARNLGSAPLLAALWLLLLQREQLPLVKKRDLL
ncbi:MAG: M50 family metallopeptidase [Oscillospiraceae bacterium]|nr:M50 family metallopeptidase [Oscillospiraceae bacterium]